MGLTLQEHLNSIAATTKKTKQEAANILAGATGNKYTTQQALQIYAGITKGTIQDALMKKASLTKTVDAQSAAKVLSGK